MPFTIRHKDPADGREYKLDSVKVFEETYKPQGFRIPKQQPVGSVYPEFPKPKPKPETDDEKKVREAAEKEAAEKEAAEKAEAEAKAAAEADAKKKDGKA